MESRCLHTSTSSSAHFFCDDPFALLPDEVITELLRRLEGSIVTSMCILPLVNQRWRDLLVRNPGFVFSVLDINFLKEAELSKQLATKLQCGDSSHRISGSPTSAIRRVAHCIHRFGDAVQRVKLSGCVLGEDSILSCGQEAVFPFAVFDPKVTEEVLAALCTCGTMVRSFELWDVTLRGLDMNPVDLSPFGLLSQMETLTAGFNHNVGEQHLVFPKSFAQLGKLREITITLSEEKDGPTKIKTPAEKSERLRGRILPNVDLQGLIPLGNTLEVLDLMALRAEEIPQDFGSSLSELREFRISLEHDVDLGALSQLKKLRSLQCAARGGITFPCSARLGALSALTDLCLASCNLVGIPTAVFSMPSLKSLDVSRNDLSKASLESFRVPNAPFSASLKKLERLSLRDGRLHDVPTGLHAHPTLLDLDLSCSRSPHVHDYEVVLGKMELTKEGVELLVSLCAVQRLNLTGAIATTAGLAQLKSLLPSHVAISF